LQPDRNRRFSEVVLPHLDAVYRAAVALAGQGPGAEDIAQATLLKALEALDSFAKGTNCKAWLLRILRNTWIDVLRRRQTAGTPLPLEEDLLPAPPAPPEPAETLGLLQANGQALLESFADEDVIKALTELPADQRLTLYLVDVEQMDHREVAGVMGVPVGTVKSRASRARAVLKQRLLAKAKDLGFVGRTSRESSGR
jgi:RNA polymerase sigma-70 factor (ECF subfamily)